MSGGKCAHKEKSEPPRKCTAIDLEMKIRMIRKYEGGKCLSAVLREFGFSGISCEHHCERCCLYKRTCERKGNDEFNSKNKEM
jgi:hypothetical protein